MPYTSHLPHLAIAFWVLPCSSVMTIASRGSLIPDSTWQQLHSARGQGVQTQIDKKAGTNSTHPT
jgi:hypothetical protein